jgi:hypothetical protein
MDNFDFVAHLANTVSALDGSAEGVENYIRSYYRAMHAISAKWSGLAPESNQLLDQAFAELNTAHQKYWLPETRFTEYWQPSLEPPDRYVIVDTGVTIFSDMLGNFVAEVRTEDRTAMYLLSVVRDELKIVNRFFR